jgi:hypothetical protein
MLIRKPNDPHPMTSINVVIDANIPKKYIPIVSRKGYDFLMAKVSFFLWVQSEKESKTRNFLRHIYGKIN